MKGKVLPYERYSSSAERMAPRLSRLGIGTYRLRTPGHVMTMRTALSSKLVSVVDTAPNYGEAEALVGEVLRSVLEEGAVERSDLTVVTKVGLLQGADLEAAQARERAGSPLHGALKLSNTAWMCLTPEYVAGSVAASAARLTPAARRKEWSSKRQP